MKAELLVGILATALLASAPTKAHFKLQAPGDALQTDSTGDPLPAGTGSQKTAPCGTGTASGVVTKVKSGSKLHIKVTETVAHGGHYRVALSQKANRSDLVEPTPTLVAGQCSSLAIDPNPVLPVLADGLFVHTQLQAKSGTVYETDVTLPNITCTNCTLQIIEFMAPHAPSCFYHHCANLEIVADDAGVDPPDAGSVTIDAGTTATSDASTNATQDSGAGTGGIPDEPGLSTSSDSGCSAAPGNSSGSVVVLVAGLMLAVGSRSRRRRK